MSNKKKHHQNKQNNTRKEIKRLVKTEKDWLEQKRTSKDGKGIPRTEKN